MAAAPGRHFRRACARRVAATLAVLAGLLAGLFSAGVAGAGPASAEDLLGPAADGLMESRLYVDPSVKQLDSIDRESIRDRLDESSTPIYVAALPEAAEDQVPRGATGLPYALYQRTGRPGTYAVLVGDQLTAGSSRPGAAEPMAREAWASSGGDPVLAVLDFVDRVQDQVATPPPTPGAATPAQPRSFPWVLLLLCAAGGAIYLHIRGSKDKEVVAVAQVRAVAEEDLAAFGDEVTAADPWDAAGSQGDQARAEHSRALSAYDRANHALVSARRPDDMAVVTAALAEGAFALACSVAASAGAPAPHRRPPCVFDPRHGPSDSQVSWAPAGGESRRVPACIGCAETVHNGGEPVSRTVPVGRRSRPYWDAGPSYAAWAGGYYEEFGGALLPRLLMGTMLGASLAVPEQRRPSSEQGSRDDHPRR